MNANGKKCVLFAIVLAVAFNSCGGVMERNPSVLVNTISADPTTLNPITATDAYAGDVNRYIFESMLERDNATLELKPKLAERWEISSDHLTYTFWLRKGVKWQDGKPLTADDVLFTFERIRDPKVDAAMLRNYYRDVKEIRKIDDYTVRITYAKPYFRALEMIGGAAIMPKHIYGDGQDFNSHPASRAPVGTGPYRFVEWKTGRDIVLTRSDSYWGEEPAIAGVVFKIVPDSTVSFQLLKKGAVDVGGMRAIQWVRQTGGKSFRENFTKHRYYLPNYSYIGWNMRSPLFKDRRVRLAMTMMVNREEILEKILLGQGEIVDSAFYKFGDQADPDLKPVPYDPDRARELLAEAGWKDTNRDGILDKDGVPFRFELLSAAGSNTARSISLFMKEDLRKMGIDMDIRQLEWATMIKLIHDRKFDATMLAWSMPLVQDPYQLWHSSQVEKGSNFVGFENVRADQLVEEARREFDKGRRNEMYREFQWIVHEEQPYTFLYTQPSLVAVAKRFGNVVAYRLGLDPLEWTVNPWPKLIEW
jgi:peptide/nickel transport system substrate-binding protein